MATSKTTSAAAEPHARGDRKPKAGGGRNLAVCIGILIAIGISYSALLVYYRGESDARSSDLQVGDATVPDRLDVYARLLSVDQQQEQAVVRLNFEPKGSVANPAGALAGPLKLFVNSANGSQERTFESGKMMNPTDVTLDMYDGSITDYPFDRFTTELQVGASTSSPSAAGTQTVPVVVDFVGSLHGLKVEESALTSQESGGVVPVNVTISRSPTTIAIAGFIMALLLAMALSVLILTLSVALWGQKLELPVVTLLGALLFGFVAFRNTLPGTPPVGALSDFLAFFWAEGIVAICLFVLVAVYLKRILRPTPAP
jgi:hypothetical protein